MGDILQHFIHELETTTRFRTRRRRVRAAYKDKEKKLLALQREENMLSRMDSEAPWIPLTPPIMRGYKRYFVLRSDVQRSKQAPFFESLLAKINTVQYFHRKDFKLSKRYRNKKVYIEQRLQEPRAYCLNKYGLTEKEMMLFEQRIDPKEKECYSVYYVFTEPWRFVLRVRPNMIDKIKALNPDLESRSKELDNKIARNFLRPAICKARSISFQWRDRSLPRAREISPLHNRPLHCILAELENDLNPPSWRN